jgi:ComF family protein
VILSTLREGLFPEGCALCGRNLKPGTDAFYGLCGPCREGLDPPDMAARRCSLCGQPLISEAETCLDCRNGPERSFDRILPLFPYTGKYRKLLGAYKFGGRLSLGNFFARQLRRGLETLSREMAGTEGNAGPGEWPLWIPVPPRPGKIKTAGWDQIAYLAKLLKETAGPGKARPRGCLRRLPSETQKTLSREGRLRNLKDRIVLKKGAAAEAVPRGAILFDDVYTTGATMDACARALKSWGVRRVYGICLCRD